jgi:Flp pilus assembly protein TadB
MCAGENNMAIQKSQGRTARPRGALESTGAPELKQDASAQSSLGDASENTPTRGGAYEADSWRSAAAFGLGALALCAPFLIPGVSQRILFISYFAVAITALSALMAWGVIREAREAWRARKRPPRMGL